MMKVYHGSTVKIETIDLAMCRPHRDFGRGFYVTRFRQHAEKMAVNMSRKHKNQPVVTEFEYRDNSFTRHICKIKQFDGYNEEWLDFVVMCRNEDNPEPAHDYDIVEGPVADDKVQNRINVYLHGKISKETFLDELKYHEPTHQICFCTACALQTIDIAGDGYDLEYGIMKIGEQIVEQLVTDGGMDAETASERFFASAVLTRLADATTGLYLRPWEEIYAMLREELKM